MPSSARPFWRRAIPAIIAGVIGAAIVAPPIWLPRSRPARETVPLPLALPKDQRVTVGGWHSVAISPDGRNIAYVANRALQVKATTEMAARPLATSPGYTRPSTALTVKPFDKIVRFCGRR
jgi:hypothetical protein